MLFLILTYRNEICLIKQNIRSHQHGIIEKTTEIFRSATIFHSQNRYLLRSFSVVLASAKRSKRLRALIVTLDNRVLMQ